MSSSPSDTGTVEVVMPQMGVSVSEGTLATWLVQPGERIEADEPICEITTDKIDVEIPSPAAGVLGEQLVAEGETVAVGTPIATIDAANRPAEPEAETPPAENGRGSVQAPEADRSSFVSPIVRRIAAEHDVDLGEVTGHGIGGRVRKRDLLAHIERARSAEGEPDQRPQRPLHSDSPYREEEPPAETMAAAPADALEQLTGPSRREPLDPMRAAIARHMVASRRTAAHCTTMIEVDFSAVERRREAMRERLERRGVRLTPLSFVAEAAVGALQEHPVLNSSFDAEQGETVFHQDVNLGFAVALDDGLIVPVLRKAQRLSLEGIAAGIGELAKRARAGDLGPDDVRGGTFTITNPGRFGATMATPIINQPQVAILDLEAIVRRPVVVADERGEESIAIRPIAYLCMSWDHRALDGVTAARFLGAIRTQLETTAEEQ